MRSLIPSIVRSPDTARAVALHVLLACQGKDAFIQEVLNDQLSQATLSGADRRLATQLAYGALRRRDSLDALLRNVCKRPQRQVETRLWEVLRLGAFQLALLTHIPAHAAVNESVKLAGSDVAAPFAAKVKSFVNGVLRAVARLMTEERTASPAADALPLEEGQYRRLAQSVLPDPGTDPLKYLAAAFSLPIWLVQRWSKRFSWDECLRLGFWFAGGAPLWLRCNPLRTNRETMLQAFSDAGIRAEPGEQLQAVRVLDAVAIRDLPGYDQGWFAVQDESAMKVAAALAPQPGGRVLDLCAAPGGKTTHLAELMRNEGTIVACDVDERRLQTVSELSRRLGHTIISTHLVNVERHEEPPPGPFDAVLVDVPCSNTGVLGRRPEVRWRLRQTDLRRLVPLQTGLLLQAAERIRPRGAIVYSTCSIEPEENRQVVEAVLKERPELMLEMDAKQVPGTPADGGYWARFSSKS